MPSRVDAEAMVYLEVIQTAPNKKSALVNGSTQRIFTYHGSIMLYVVAEERQYHITPRGGSYGQYHEEHSPGLE